MRSWSLALFVGLLLLCAAEVCAKTSLAELKVLCGRGEHSRAAEVAKQLVEELENPLVLTFLPNEGELTSLLRSRHWPSIQAAFFARLDAGLSGDYRYELQARVAKDQWVRAYANFEPKAEAQMLAIDEDNLRYLKALVGERGWPLKSKDGELVAQAAFILLQHSPDAGYQAEMLPTLERLVKEGECSGGAFALLYDRVQVRHGKPQRYGSQVRKVNGQWEPIPPLEDAENLDALRAEVGLGSTAEYLEVIRGLYDRGGGWFF